MNKLYVVLIIVVVFIVQISRASECFYITSLKAFNIKEGKHTTIDHIGCINGSGGYYDYLMDMEYGYVVETVAYDNHTDTIVVGEKDD